MKKLDVSVTDAVAKYLFDPDFIAIFLLQFIKPVMHQPRI
jgi:hypothetical protein